MCCRSSMVDVMVAEKSIVVRFEGSTSRIMARCGAKQSSSSLSASSKTRKLTLLSASLTPCELLTWSASLPGVAMTTWGRRQRLCACTIMSIPPTTTYSLSCMEAPRAANWSRIWKASSLVGVSTRAYTPKGSLESDCRMGSANAAVFPLPVWAEAMMFRPLSAGPMQFHCTSVGRVSPMLSQLRTSQSSTPSAPNDLSSSSPASSPFLGALPPLILTLSAPSSSSEPAAPR
mmetsp:Transcript_16119/g.37252  ORF Transcript_16119/g.37252 Transcript_16119/m.37252 type:complete len:232 (-) Transcript_16119:148-843(-)